MSPSRFMFDEDVDYRVVAGLRRLEPAIDLLTVVEAGLKGASDPNVLRFSAASNRILVSNDRKTMIGHFARFIATRGHPGLIILRQRVKVGVAVNALLRLWAESDAAEFRNRIRYLVLSRF